ncbi:MAG: hypothetical protein K940chlam1_00895 [Candidatus Anoxychlamydiales bacterium]|nr:hypothetical protein [Candidatus Anoxychlamydiales bacterium]NGX36338.1 hypothetical protein [Candidatus Anoxychlamydiales bacterium]
MTKNIIFKILICLFSLGIALYSYIEKQNKLTFLKMKVPAVVKEVEALGAEIKKIQYEVEVYENPAYLMQLIRKPEFGYLKHPFVEDVLTMPEGIALFDEKENKIYTP